MTKKMKSVADVSLCHKIKLVPPIIGEIFAPLELIFTVMNIMETAIKRHTLAVLLCFALVGCERTEQVWPTADFLDNSIHISIDTLELTKIQLDSIYCSGIGVSGIKDGGIICYYDYYLGYLSSFSLNGTFIKRELGIGNGPHEVVIKHPLGCYISPRGDLVLIGSNLDIQSLSYNGGQKYFTIPYRPDLNSGGASFSTYSFAEDANVKVLDDLLFVSMYSEHPNFNMFASTNVYLSEANHIGRINLHKHTTDMIALGFPHAYRENPYLLFSFAQTRFDLYTDKKILVSFEGTPELYVCDRNGTPIKTFGVPGKDMDQDYLPVRSFEEIENYIINRSNKGYYADVTILDDYIFRSYRKGNHTQSDGLQIYKNEVLIADVDVPKGLYVTGKSGKIYVSNAFFNEDTERLYCYEFEME